MRVALFLASLLVTTAVAERINHEGRILGDAPVVSAPTLFNTADADAIVSAMQIMPVDSAWNEDISARPLLANSGAMIAQIKADLLSTRQTLRPFYEMNYVLVPQDQPRQSIRFTTYPTESDLDGGSSPYGLYPVPSNMPIETWPRGTGSLTLEQWQRDVNNTGGDRHSIIVQPATGGVWETWQARLVNSAWQASNGAKFNLNSNALRPAGWTSGDAAGLPMFPAIVRYDECERGMVEHALRLVVKITREAYIYPATHEAGAVPASSVNHPAMGQRLRADFVIPANWHKHEKAVLLALKKYGGLVADNGNFFSISVAPDNRFPSNAFSNLQTIDINNFEVVQTTGLNQGPRGPGAPTVNAGPDLEVLFPSSAFLNGVVNEPSGAAAVLWYTYAGPGMATFADATNRQNGVTFSAPGSYTLMLSAADGVHAVAYDAVIVRVVLSTALSRTGNDVVVSFQTVLNQRYRVEQASSFAATNWATVTDNMYGNGGTMSATDFNALSSGTRFYRILALP